MSISSKNRKILWGKSGNRCAICKQKMVFEQTKDDPESVVGEECHIVSGAQTGPRYDPNYEKNKVDTVANIILLCRVHHKKVDDQTHDYSSDRLRKIKEEHEQWVESRLSESQSWGPWPKRLEKEIPEKLSFISSGRELMNMATQTYANYSNYSDNLNSEEAKMVGGFIQYVKDWGDFYGDLDVVQQMELVSSVDQELSNLQSIGFFVFAAVEKQYLENTEGARSDFPVLHLSVMRYDEEDIVLPKEDI